MFEVVIQLGASLAVLGLFLKTLLPKFKNCGMGGFFKCRENIKTWTLWSKIIVAVIPSAIIGLLFDDWFDEHFYNAGTVATTLALYGILYIIVEYARRGKDSTSGSVHDISYAKAFGMGCFQILALIPGTSRSGSTILGGLMLGLSRGAAAEMSFFLALPTMLGASALKGAKFFLEGNALLREEVLMLTVGALAAFFVSLVTIRFLLGFVKRRGFLGFGIYRIALGAAVLFTLIPTKG
jgi:undecaprenyl-diphosphatase